MIQLEFHKRNRTEINYAYHCSKCISNFNNKLFYILSVARLLPIEFSVFYS